MLRHPFLHTNAEHTLLLPSDRVFSTAPAAHARGSLQPPIELHRSEERTYFGHRITRPFGHPPPAAITRHGPSRPAALNPPPTRRPRPRSPTLSGASTGPAHLGPTGRGRGHRPNPTHPGHPVPPATSRRIRSRRRGR